MHPGHGPSLGSPIPTFGPRTTPVDGALPYMSPSRPGPHTSAALKRIRGFIGLLAMITAAAMVAQVVVWAAVTFTDCRVVRLEPPADPAGPPGIVETTPSWQRSDADSPFVPPNEFTAGPVPNSTGDQGVRSAAASPGVAPASAPRSGRRMPRSSGDVAPPPGSAGAIAGPAPGPDRDTEPPADSADAMADVLPGGVDRADVVGRGGGNAVNDGAAASADAAAATGPNPAHLGGADVSTSAARADRGGLDPELARHLAPGRVDANLIASKWSVWLERVHRTATSVALLGAIGLAFEVSMGLVLAAVGAAAAGISRVVRAQSWVVVLVFLMMPWRSVLSADFPFPGVLTNYAAVCDAADRYRGAIDPQLVAPPVNHLARTAGSTGAWSGGPGPTTFVTPAAATGAVLPRGAVASLDGPIETGGTFGFYLRYLIMPMATFVLIAWIGISFALGAEAGIISDRPSRFDIEVDEETAARRLFNKSGIGSSRSAAAFTNAVGAMEQERLHAQPLQSGMSGGEGGEVPSLTRPDTPPPLRRLV